MVTGQATWSGVYSYTLNNRPVPPQIVSVDFYNNVATVVRWSDGDITRVVARGIDEFNPEQGLAMAIAKKFCGSYENFMSVLNDSTGHFDEDPSILFDLAFDEDGEWFFEYD